MNAWKSRRISFFILGIILISMPWCHGFTDQQDIFAISYLYLDLGSPPLPGWRINGDPCLEIWHGVECVLSSITGIILDHEDLGGQLSDSLGNFSSLITLDLSNNHIGGKIPENLPSTVREFFLSANKFTGTIPNSLSKLTLITNLTVNDNLLEGELPDAFQSLTNLVNLDVSSNNLTGQLPLSIGDLSVLTTLNMQNNHLSGVLTVLSELPLVDLNIENNLFSGPIPPKLLTIPNFRKDGNPFNTSVLPSTSPASSPIPVSDAPAPISGHSKDIIHSGAKGGKSIMKVIAYVVIAVTSLIVAVLIVTMCISKLKNKAKEDPQIMKHEKLKSVERSDSNLPTTIIKHIVPENAVEKQKEHTIHMTESSTIMIPHPFEKPKIEPQKIQSVYPKFSNPPSVTSFSVALLQQYTNSFAEGNLICENSISKIYMAELPDGKLLTVMNLDNTNSKTGARDFLDFISVISNLHSPYIIELVGYCMEYEQRVLVYNYFSKTTLHDILHCDDKFKKNLSWNARVEIALGAARALEYLHEGCHPPVTHKFFNSSKIFVDECMNVCVSECGLASLTTSIYNDRVHAQPGSEAPEVNNTVSSTNKSDVYGFGVVMLELLTGRKPYESWRPREERYLVRWASSQLYDIDGLSRIVDPSLNGEVPKKSLSSFADIINRCIQQQPEFRAAMAEVVQDLAHLMDNMRSKNVNQPTFL